MKTSSQTALKVLSIIGIVVGAIIAVSGIVLTVGANGFAMYQASSSGAGVAVLGTIGGVVLIVAGAFNVVVGVFGIVFNALGLIMEATGSGISASSLIGTLFVVVLFILANNIKKQA